MTEIDGVLPSKPTWWYWQAYRTWVPYSPTHVRAIEQAFHAAEPSVALAGTEYEVVFGAGSHQQRRIGLPGVHRDVARVVIPAEWDLDEEQGRKASRTLRAIGFRTQQRMDASSGHASRLTETEIAAGHLDVQYQIASMDRTIREQLDHPFPPNPWISDPTDTDGALCSLNARLPTAGVVPSTKKVPTAARSPAAPRMNPIIRENLRPGRPSTEWDVNGAGDPTIQGFASPISVHTSETVAFKIQTDAICYRVDIYRLGYYGGDGARLVHTENVGKAVCEKVCNVQPEPMVDVSTGLADCGNWKTSLSWSVPEDAVSGLYIARLVRFESTKTWRADNTQAGPGAWMTGAGSDASATGKIVPLTEGGESRAPCHAVDDAQKPVDCDDHYPSSYCGGQQSASFELREPRASLIYFVVRDDGSEADIVFQTSDTTWQAYNSYGGTSLYGSFGTRWDSPPEPRAYVASYNRPIVTRDYRAINAPFGAEYPLIRFLERNGYHVCYQTGVDTHLRGVGGGSSLHGGSPSAPHGNGAGPLSSGTRKVFISAGHDEYWSGPQRDAVERARDSGTNLCFFSGNEVFWRVRWEHGAESPPSADSPPHGGAPPPPTSGGVQVPTRMVCYKESMATKKLDPLFAEWTGTWRDWRAFNPIGSRPENSLTGTMYMVDTWNNAPILVPPKFAQHRFWRHTSVAAEKSPRKSVVLLKGLIGHEFDEDIENGSRPPGLMRLSETRLDNVVKLQDQGATFDSGTATHRLVLYRHPINNSSSSLVFGAGTAQWSWGLDGCHDSPHGVPPHVANPYSTRVGRDLNAPDLIVQQATVNLLADMGVRAGTLEGGLVEDEGMKIMAENDIVAGVGDEVERRGVGEDRGPRTELSECRVDAGVLRMGGKVKVGPEAVLAGVEVAVDSGRWWAADIDGQSGAWELEMPYGGEGPGKNIVCRAVDDWGRIEKERTVFER